MGELNRQGICAALGVSESTIRRLEQQGLPYTPVGQRSHRYDLVECKEWLKANPPGVRAGARRMATAWMPSKELDWTTCKRPLRVMPSE
jgi:phage terminase Nu1 subunit (DNA packaging protein)